MNKASKTYKRYVFWVWLGVVTTILALYYSKFQSFDIQNAINLVNRHYIMSLVIYFVFVSTRGLTLIPTAPVVLLGIAVFKSWEVLGINMAGILISSTLVYYFAQYLGFDTFFEHKYPKYMPRIRKLLNNRDIPLIAAWSFFPPTPTDFIVYLSSTLDIPLSRCLTGVFIGELIINCFLVFSVKNLLQL